MAGGSVLDELAGYLELTQEDSKLIAECAELVRPHFPHIVDRFYDIIEQHSGARSVLSGVPAQIDRLKGALCQWLEELVGGVYDDAYLQRRLRMGRVHVRIGLEQRYLFAAMNVVRSGFHAALSESLDAMERPWPAAKRRAGHGALDKACDLELALLLESYREDYMGRSRAQERLATVGQVAASIAHELRNPLAVAETSLHLLRSPPVADSHTKQHLDRIGEQVRICSTIIADLLEMARNREPNREPTDVVRLVREAVDMVPMSDGVSVELDVPGELRSAFVDPVQFRQVVVNLLMNGSQAVQDANRSGTVNIRLAGEGDTLRVRVEDDGHGLTPEVQPHLFEPLFTTRSRGIGLGLALCRQIVERHGGYMWGDNRPEGGAVFEFVLPHAMENC